MRGDGKLALRSQDVRAALDEALGGRGARLGELLARHGGLPSSRPNLALAEAFGEAIAAEGPAARPVLTRLRDDPAEAESPRAFLPVAAAFGYAARLRSDPRDAWEGIFELGADDRAPVRLGLIAALTAFVARGAGHADDLVAHADEWLEADDREHVYASQAIALDVLAARRGLDGLEQADALFAWLARIIERVANAPRADERSPARRKLLAALPSALAEAASSLRGGTAWLEARIAEAPHPDLRAMFERTIDALRRGPRAQGAPVVQALTAALATTKKAPRDPTRVRGGVGRGRKGRKRAR